MQPVYAVSMTTNGGLVSRKLPQMHAAIKTCTWWWARARLKTTNSTVTGWWARARLKTTNLPLVTPTPATGVDSLYSFTVTGLES